MKSHYRFLIKYSSSYKLDCILQFVNFRAVLISLSFRSSSHIRIVEKLILHLFLFYGNGQLKQFC
ncbi:hypothetical protein FFZ99_12155 [Leptospira interrogans]|nr:hypothetical protein FF006_12165 [Leptospira interrogans]TQE62249.1 hypothetical protein FFZ99_12155 [Leptospira interrogans]TQE66391.1 hypothetical protein FF001_11420 [Leptospira interrogans]TQE72716.1 hypothetical protein FF002_12425 [Leptospira interrogans]